MGPTSTFKAFAVVLVVALFSAAASAQNMSAPAAPAGNTSVPASPARQAGAAGSVSISVALIGASVILSMLAILKN